MPSRPRDRGAHAPPRVAGRAPATRSSHRDPLRGAWLAHRLAPARVLVFARLGSTNRTATQRLEAGTLAAPAIVAASSQTRGRGQRANTWWSDAGSLCATFVLPVDPTMPVGQVPLRAGLAVAGVIRRHLPDHRVEVKWPNDVLVDGRKIAGLLCARARNADLIGLGLNVRTNLRHAPDAVRARAASLSDHLATPPCRDELISALWTALLAERAAADWIDRFRALHALDGREITVEDEGTSLNGTCRGIDQDGRLLLDDAATVHAITSGTVLNW